jgi:hypothetical protein
MTSAAAAVTLVTAFKLVPQPLDLLSQAIELTAYRLVLVLLFSPFVDFLLELIEALPQVGDLLPQITLFRFRALFTMPGVVLRFVPPSPQSFQIASEHPEFAPDLLPGRALIFPRHWTALVHDRQSNFRYRLCVGLTSWSLSTAGLPRQSKRVFYTISRCKAAWG